MKICKNDLLLMPNWHQGQCPGMKLRAKDTETQFSQVFIQQRYSVSVTSPFATDTAVVFILEKHLNSSILTQLGEHLSQQRSNHKS